MFSLPCGTCNSSFNRLNLVFLFAAQRFVKNHFISRSLHESNWPAQVIMFMFNNTESRCSIYLFFTNGCFNNQWEVRCKKKIWIWIWPSYWAMGTRPTLQRQKKKSTLFCNQKIIMEAICILWHRRLVLHQNLLKLGWRGRGQRRLMMKSWGGVKVTIITKLKIIQTISSLVHV